MTNRIIPLKEISLIVGRHPRTVWRWWAKEGTFPSPLMNNNGRCIGWLQQDLDLWIEKSAAIHKTEEAA
ncbi:helix-turn-helix transcriptional regulator [Vibrio alginolyticus]|uniref:helix-turn-helix transcriptional regulator n=1 Tax=Vibrio alginolyticus TaxID=663 RepID=UPI001E0148AC|nr:AlpA family transcriptional regulator [Vibrio alginolyticus]MBR9789006.1 AlpA family phage regulatory protein [Vibrionaceae bacterium]MCS0292963.1 AlpA family transcriptional regulator [Vibrio alginolyticus]HCM0912618.1 AlpA family phage regulatory protein [Vibrio parahaemolyticus]